MRPTVLATDLDHTLIPLPGNQENADDLARLDDALQQSCVKLVYVTGRHFASAIAAIDEFNLPTPDWIISNVGTTIHHNGSSGLVNSSTYENHLRQLMPNGLLERQKSIFAAVKSLTIQEAEKQSEFKLSYYVPQSELETVVESVRQRLLDDNEQLSIIASTDPVSGVGLLDLLPAEVTKAYALNWWAKERGFSKQSIVFAGDSGNDLAVFSSGCLAVVVGNADASVRKIAKDSHARAGWTKRLFLAEKTATSGVLEGCRHFNLIS